MAGKPQASKHVRRAVAAQLAEAEAAEAEAPEEAAEPEAAEEPQTEATPESDVLNDNEQ